MKTANDKIEIVDANTMKVNGRTYTVQQRTGEDEFKAAYPNAYKQLGIVGSTLLRGKRGAHLVVWSYSDGSKTVARV